MTKPKQPPKRTKRSAKTTKRRATKRSGVTRDAAPFVVHARRRRRLRRFGEHRVCMRCGNTELDSMERHPRSDFEEHHLVGQVNSDALTLTLCKNCHAYLTELNRDEGISMDPPPNLLERIVTILRALAVSLPILGALLDQLARRLQEFVESLTVSYPNWEDLDVAR